MWERGRGRNTEPMKHERAEKNKRRMRGIKIE